MLSSDLLKIYQWGRRTAVEGGEGGMEAATVCFILCFFGQGKFIFIREMSENFEH